MQKKLVLVLVCAAVALGACSKKDGAGNAAASKAKDSVIITMDQESEPAAGFDPIMGWAAGEHTHDPLFQSTLLITKDDITIGNDLATDYTISQDGLTWTFKIRGDVKFTDGKPLVASDVAFTYNNAKKQVTETDLSMLDSAEAPDASTVVFHFNRPYSAFAYIAAVVGIVPEHAYNAATYGQKPIGSGPYILKQWDKGEQVILEANPGYYGEKSNIKKITIVFMSEDASYVAAQAGRVDVAYTAPSYTVNPVKGYQIVAFDSVDIRGINMPCIPAGNRTPPNAAGETLPAGNNATRNRAIRQAFATAVDRDALVKDVLLGYGAPAYSDSHGELWENPAMKVAYDPAKAKSIMEADGWELGPDGIYQKGGQKAEFNLLYMASNSVRTSLAMAVAEMAGEVGILIHPQADSSDKILYYEIPRIFGSGMHSPAGMVGNYYSGKNGASYSNSTVDRHIDEALAAHSVEESYDLWKTAYWDGSEGVTPTSDSPWVWLVEIDHIYFVRDGLHAVDHKIHPHGYGWTIINNVDQWYWD
jgi:peptide/nickel transport system substrate-binding protein